MPLTKSEQSRINGANSNGPVTPEGKRRSSLNALKHGFYSDLVLLPNENREKFEAHRNSYIESLQPSTGLAFDLLDQMTSSMWRLRRAWATETIALTVELERQPGDLTEDEKLYAATKALTEDSNFLNNLSRAEDRLDRHFHRAARNFLRLKNAMNEPTGGTEKNEDH